MKRGTIIQIVVTMALVLATAGCQYNGATTLNPFGSAKEINELTQFKQQLAEQRAASARSSLERSSHEHRVDPQLPRDDPSLPDDDSSLPDVGNSAWPAVVPVGRYSSTTPTNSTALLGLYGQLPQPELARTSPLDSPDNVSRVTFTDEGADFDPDIDPTGQWLVFASTQHRYTADLYLKHVDGTAVTQLTNDPGNDVMPVFSSDGERVAFASDRSGNWDIYIMSVDGGQPIQLTDDTTHDIHPSFSPDGKQLVYCSYGAQSGQWELVVIDVDNPATKKFIANGLFPSWSPTDNRILFQRARERGTRWFSVWTIELVDGEGVQPTEVAASTNAAVITPEWSSDGQHIVFCTVVDPQADNQIRPAQADVWIMSTDGRSRTNLTSDLFANLQPVWAPDGLIFFVSDRARGGIENIWAIRPDRAMSVVQHGGDDEITENDSAAMVPTDPGN